MKEVQVYKHRSCFLIRYLEMVTIVSKKMETFLERKFGFSTFNSSKLEEQHYIIIIL